MPDITLSRTEDPLLRHLLDTGQCAPHRIATRNGTWVYTEGLAVTSRPFRLLDAARRPHPRRYAFGVPTESVHWVTAAGIRPGVNSVTLTDSDAFNPVPRWGATASARWRLLDFGRSGAAEHAAELGAEAGRLESEAAEREIRLAVRRAYLGE